MVINNIYWKSVHLKSPSVKKQWDSEQIHFMIQLIADRANSKTCSKTHTQLPLSCFLFIVRIWQDLNLCLRILGTEKCIYIFILSKLLMWDVTDREPNWKSGQDLNIYVRISGKEHCIYIFYSFKSFNVGCHRKRTKLEIRL